MNQIVGGHDVGSSHVAALITAAIFGAVAPFGAVRDLHLYMSHADGGKGKQGFIANISCDLATLDMVWCCETRGANCIMTVTPRAPGKPEMTLREYVYKGGVLAFLETNSLPNVQPDLELALT